MGYDDPLAITTVSQRLKTELRGLGLVVNYIRDLDSTVEIDVADDALQQAEAVDIIWSYQHLGEQFRKKIKVRTDTKVHTTGNLTFEYAEDIIRGIPGYFPRTTADLLYYLAIETGDLYIIKMEDVRRWFENETMKFPRHFQTATAVTRQENGTSTTSIFYLVPLETVAENVGLYRRKIEVK